MKKALISGGAFVLLLAPLVGFAANGFLGPIVPNEFFTKGPYLRGCDIVVLFDSVLKFAVGFSVIVATLMFTYAGFLYVTASSNANNIKEATKIFSTVAFGLFWILAAWLIINIIMSVLTDQTKYPWTNIECIDYPEAKAPGSGRVTTTEKPGGLVPIDSFECKNQESCEVPSTTNLSLAQMRSNLLEQGANPSEYQITETGVGQTVEHASGSGNLDMSCRGKCSPQQVKAAVEAWPGRTVYETNSTTDRDAMLRAGVPSANIKYIPGTFSADGTCSAGVGKCITAPHMSLYPPGG